MNLQAGPCFSSSSYLGYSRDDIYYWSRGRRYQVRPGDHILDDKHYVTALGKRVSIEVVRKLFQED